MRYAVLVMLAIGCYEAPDYSGTHFKCDSTHACPDGQACVNGSCAGSGSNMPDAPSGMANGVACGSAICTGAQKCCADVVNGLSCIATTALCAGFGATCDGKEDCNGGLCCGGSADISCGTGCSAVICREAADCPSTTPMCCPIIGTGEPWGRCNVSCP